jgi:hypothetical protein
MSRGLTPAIVAECTLDQIMIMALPVEHIMGTATAEVSDGWPSGVPRAKPGVDTSGGSSVVQRIRAKRQQNAPAGKRRKRSR